MALESGTQLGHYEITDQIGKGGMGEVYRARDTKLGRQVAIKVLPAEFSQDDERLTRLEREARMLAALNHPNIAAIHGLEESDGTRFLVLELVEGDTLAERLKRGAIPVDEALKLALQVAEALEAAHEKGVIHRDLKPANIKITPEGRIKVLDFGLAKAFAGEAADLGLSNSPTLSMAATQQGIVLGTAAYMSPEQASGEPVDHRSDVWAFGVVLFEMLSGRALFGGKTVTHVLASVMKDDPDWSLLSPALPPRVRFLLERCLEKERNDRCQRVSEARAELQRALAEPLDGARTDVSPSPAPGPRRTLLPWVAGIVLSVIVGSTVWWLRPSPEPRLIRYGVEVPGGLSNPVISVSPAGDRFVFASGSQLYQQRLDQMEATPIPGTEGGVWPFFSPDGESVAFFVGPRLLSVALSGGAPVQLATAANGGVVGDWDSEGRIFFGQNGPYGLSQVPATGGQPEPFAEPGEGTEDLDFPDVLPGGEWVLYTEAPDATDWDSARLVAENVRTGERKVLLQGGYFGRYAPTGHLIYALGGSLYAVPFDAERVEVTGTPVEVVSGVLTIPAGGLASFAFSDDGTLAYIPGENTGGGGGGETRLTWVDREGNETLLPLEADAYRFVRVSPDGTRAALVIADEEGGTNIWVLDFDAANAVQITSDGGAYPLWKDDDTLIFGSDANVYSIPSEGGDQTLIGGSDEFIGVLPWSLSPDGQTLTVAALRSPTDIVMGLLPTNGEGELSILPVTDAAITNEPSVSPNGNWIAFFQASVDRTTATLNIRSFPDIERQRRILGPDFARHPVWSADGSELFFFDRDGVRGVTVQYEPSLRFGPEQPLFSGASYWWGAAQPNGAGGRAWDFDSTSDRFLALKLAAASGPDEAGNAPRVNVVVNWFQDLRERVPVD